MRPLSLPNLSAAILLPLLAACHTAAELPPSSAATEWPVQRWSAGDPYAPELGNRGYEVARYDLRLALDPAREALTGKATLFAKATEGGLEWVTLDLVGLKVREVRVNGAPATHTRLGPKLFVRLPAALAKGEAFTLTVAYGGRPVQERSRYVPFLGNLGVQRADSVTYVMSEPDGARYWFPCNDHPTDKALFRIEVAVPAGLTGVANGVLAEKHEAVADALGAGKAGDVFAWEMRQPMATYLATVAVGNFVRVEGRSPKGVKLRHYVPAELAPAYTAFNARLGEAVDWMGDQFGTYPFEEFGYVVVPGFPGGFESQGMVIMGTPAAADEGVLVHELAHQWFGDWATPASWEDMWFNEGFATFLASRAWPVRHIGLPAVDPAAVRSSDHALGHPPCRELFGQVTYEKGASFVAALRQEMGEEAFNRGVRAFMTRHGGGTFTRAEFQQTMESAAGRPLSGVFVAWLEGATPTKQAKAAEPVKAPVAAPVLD